MVLEPPSRAEGSGLFTVALYNIRSGCNGGLESALRAMKQMGVDCGVLLETKLTEGVYTRWSSGYNVRSTHAPSKWQGGISLFWRTIETYEIEEVELRGPNVLSFQLVLGTMRWYIIGCYIPPTNLTTLTHVNEAWWACPKGCLPILLGDLNVNLAAPRNERDDTITKQVDAMALINMSNHFRQQHRRRSRGRWTWRMRRGRRWASSQCDYVLGRATNLGQWIWRISVQTPFCHDSNHRAIVAEIRAGGGRAMAKYQKWCRRFPLKIPWGPHAELVSKYEELRLDVIPPPLRGSAPPTDGYWIRLGRL
jgi:hypothetical protein